ncbi:MAG: MotA/TolQ/ExbB proton channel family protein [Dechloromonas sp.]|nr:MotA/TolQ/ExbB proton channel family protein [Dechloromonas sp.]
MNPTIASPLGNSLDSLMYGLSQLFLIPVMLTIAVLFLYAFYALGAFGWQAMQRRRGQPEAFELLALQRAAPQLSSADLEAAAVSRLEFVRIVTRVAPMLGLVATMIPMGPALKALGDGQLSDIATSLMQAFSAVILALIASAITYAIAHVRRRWYASDLMLAEQDAGVRP